MESTCTYLRVCDGYTIVDDNYDLFYREQIPSYPDPENWKLQFVVMNINWGKENPIPGAIMEVSVGLYYECKVGDTFYTVDNDDQIVFARLLSVVSMDRTLPKIRIEVIEVHDILSFVQPVSDIEISRIKEAENYDYEPPFLGTYDISWPIAEFSLGANIGKRFFFVANPNDGSGVASVIDTIYTDENGIDHLVSRMNRNYSCDEIMSFGDKVLGLHENCPFFRIENGLLIDLVGKRVMACFDDGPEIIIPQGIMKLTEFSFYQCKMERVIIPDSVCDVHLAFMDCPNLKEVILTGDAIIQVDDFWQDACRCCSDAKDLIIRKDDLQNVDSGVRDIRISKLAETDIQDYDDWDGLNRDGKTHKKKHYISGSGIL